MTDIRQTTNRVHEDAVKEAFRKKAADKAPIGTVIAASALKAPTEGPTIAAGVGANHALYKGPI